MPKLQHHDNQCDHIFIMQYSYYQKCGKLYIPKSLILSKILMICMITGSVWIQFMIDSNNYMKIVMKQ